MKGLDAVDYNILGLLDRKSRCSVNEIAKKLKISRDVARYRIKQLEQKEYILGYIPVIDYSRLGYSLIRLYLQLQNADKEQENSIISFLKKDPRVAILYKTDGKYDLAMGVLVSSLNEYESFFSELLTKFRRYIAKHNFSVFKEFRQYYRAYLGNDKPRNTEISTGNSKLYTFDKIDLCILESISTNARKSLISIGKECAMPPTTAKYRLQKLMKNRVIVACRIHPNLTKMGYAHYKTDVMLNDYSILPSIHKWLKEHPNVIYRDDAIGGTDVEFDAELPSQQEYYTLISQLKEKFPGKIKSTSYYKVIDVLKYKYYPEMLK